MLCLTREAQQQVYVTTKSGERIIIRVVEAMNGKVRLGFDADQSTIIDREEIHWRKQQ